MERITTSETQWDVLGKVYNAVYRLREIENILGNDYDLDQLKELVEADEDDTLYGEWLANTDVFAALMEIAMEL